MSYTSGALSSYTPVPIMIRKHSIGSTGVESLEFDEIEGVINVIVMEIHQQQVLLYLLVMDMIQLVMVMRLNMK